MLIAAVVHHGHRPLLPVLNAGQLFCVKEAGLVPVQLAKQETREMLSSVPPREAREEDARADLKTDSPPRPVPLGSPDCTMKSL